MKTLQITLPDEIAMDLQEIAAIQGISAAAQAAILVTRALVSSVEFDEIAEGIVRMNTESVLG